LRVRTSPDRPSGKSVVLITLDTTRSDRLGVYGCPDVRTPALDRLAREGALVVSAVADVPVTLPSHATIMTGVPALGHGVRFNADFKVGAAARTLAEEYADVGYDTAAIVSSIVLLSKFGLDQGFAHYDDDLTPGYVKHDESKYSKQDHWLPKADRRAEETVDHALEWLEHEARSPFFLWVHFYDPHFPFDPPPPWGITSPDAYLAELQYTDHALRRLLGWLEKNDEEAVVLLTADHGEGLDQHREDGHGIFLYDETIRVPLVVRDPDTIRPGTLITEQVPTTDLAPTALALSGHAERHLGIGRSVGELLRGGGAPSDSVAYCESIKTKLFYGGSGLKSVRTKNAKYVWAPHPELYDLVADPGETTNLVEVRPELARGMKMILDEKVRTVLRDAVPFTEPAEADEATLRSLRSLGYLSGSDGSARPGSFEREMGLVGNDPKDLVDVSMGAREIQNGFYERGEEKLLRFFATARPPHVDRGMARLWAAAHQNYAKIWMVRGDYRRAAAEYRKATLADPTYDNARWSHIYALNLARDFDRAEEESARVLAQHPRAWNVRLHRGLSLALLGRRDEAERELRYVAKNAPSTSDVVKNALFYAGKLGTPQEKTVLVAYLESEAKRASK
jgi:arylsulfatase A-like enzyme